MANSFSSSSTSSNDSNASPVLEKVSTPGVPLDAVRTVSFKDSDKAAECLIQAFAKDEVARYFIDTNDMGMYGEDVKWKLHCDIMRYITAAHCLNGLVTAVGDEEDAFGAVALWLPPHTSIDSLYTLFRSGLWRLYFKLSTEGRQRYFTEFMPLLHDTKHAVLGHREEESYYLVYLGSKPSARGKGYARVLIEHGIQLADSQNRLTYLESSAHSNIEYYKKFGFVEERDIVLNRGTTPIYLHIMVRQPESSMAAKSDVHSGRQKVVMSGVAGATAGSTVKVANLVSGKSMAKTDM